MLYGLLCIVCFGNVRCRTPVLNAFLACVPVDNLDAPGGSWIRAMIVCGGRAADRSRKGGRAGMRIIRSRVGSIGRIMAGSPDSLRIDSEEIS